MLAFLPEDSVQVLLKRQISLSFLNAANYNRKRANCGLPNWDVL
jgi:hypothetical protein